MKKNISLLLLSFLILSSTGAMAQSVANGPEIKSIRLGSNLWMAENLDVITEGSFEVEKAPGDSLRYGRLYTWEAAQKACPAGWHLPSDADWDELVNINGGEDLAAYYLKKNGTSGFNALTAGMQTVAGYMFKDYLGGYWSSANYDEEHAWYRYFTSKNDFFTRTYYSKSYGFSVRCVQNKTTAN
jgi:uncharacterized protein (TIGR02145 family)